jgi:hypothetical protein
VQVAGNRSVHGIVWTKLHWPDGGIGYYAFRNGIAIEFAALTVPRNNPPSAQTVAVLNQVLSSFEFADGPLRLDHRIAALKSGQRIGGLTIRTVLPGAVGFGHTTGTIEFSGQLTLTGNVEIDRTMLGGSSGYYIDGIDETGRSTIPMLDCPLKGSAASDPHITFSNQGFAEREFGKRDGIEGGATVVIDRLKIAFYNGVPGAMTARLISVRDIQPAD